MLQLPQLSDAPWTASSALFLSLILGLMAVVTALQLTMFLSSVCFQPSRSVQLRRIFRVSDALDLHHRHGESTSLHTHACAGTLLFGAPHQLLSYSIICSFVGIGLITISPLWTQSTEDGRWGGPQKVSYNSVRSSYDLGDG
jgi:hypothetical protein